MAGTVRPPAASSVSIPVSVRGGGGGGDAHAMTAMSGPGSTATPSAAMAKVCPTCGVHYPAEFKVCPRDAAELNEEAEAEAERDELVGQTLSGSYTVLRVIGEGGMGRVYEARHTRIGSKRFAIKMLHPEYARQPEVISRFQREAEDAMRRSGAPTWSTCTTSIDRPTDARSSSASTFSKARSSRSYLGDVRQDAHRAGGARRAARSARRSRPRDAKGVVHRDMKPENVFLTGDLTRPIAKVIDFGISKVGDSPGTALTKTGMIMGTPSYMAPEQARGEKVDHRVDIYAVGAILYCALTGQRPFDRGDPTATLTAVLTQDPPRPRSIEPSIPEPLEVVIQRAMAKRPVDRYGSMAELDADLAPYDAGGEIEIALPTLVGPGGARGGNTMAARRAGSGLLDKQAREVALARPTILLLSGLGAVWLMAGLIGTITAGVRLLRGGVAGNLTGSEAVFLVVGIAFTMLTPLLLGVRYVSRDVWSNSMKAVDLADRLRVPVIAGLGAYGFASLLVRGIEAVVLRHAVGVAWPVWDILLFSMGVAALPASRSRTRSPSAASAAEPDEGKAR